MTTIGRIKDFFAGTIRRQLTFGMAFIILVAMSLFVFGFIKKQEQIMMEQRMAQGIALVNSIATTSNVWVASRDLSGLREIILGLAAYPDLKYALILDSRGHVLADTDSSKVGLYVNNMPKTANMQIIENSFETLDIITPIMLNNRQIGWARMGLSNDFLENRLTQIKYSSAIFIFLTTIIGVLFATLTGKYLTSRLGEITRVMDYLKANSAGVRVNLQGDNEAAQLAKQFNQMLDVLDEREIELKRSEQKLFTILESVDAYIFLKDINGNYLFANRLTRDMLGVGVDDIIGKGDEEFFSSELSQKIKANDRLVLDLGQTIKTEEERYIAKLHKNVILLNIKLPLYDENGKIYALCGIATDITDRKIAEERITELAYFDQLTNLPNRRLLLERLRQAMSVSEASGAFCALMFIDLDNFKTLNDTLGHDVGDLLLKNVAERIKNNVRDCDTVSRFGGDEFVVILDGLSTDFNIAKTSIESIAHKFIHELNKVYELGNITYQCTASIGITIFSGESVAPESLMKQADLAMYHSKTEGRNAFSFFNTDMELCLREHSALENDIKYGVRNSQFVVYYQPQIKDDKIIGAEALLRWLHPTAGMVPPNKFIPAAEETDLIIDIGNFVLQNTCEQLALWAQKDSMKHLSIAINVSAKQFRRLDFVEHVLDVLKQTNANPNKLKIELTESLLVENLEDIVYKMEVLKSHGVNFSLDDFGTGYSSLSYLKRLPLDQLKIDQGFVRDILIDANDAVICKSTIAIANSMGFEVIAEGVETQEQKDALSEMGCHAYQGYLFSKPIPVENFELLFK